MRRTKLSVVDIIYIWCQQNTQGTIEFSNREKKGAPICGYLFVTGDTSTPHTHTDKCKIEEREEKKNLRKSNYGPAIKSKLDARIEHRTTTGEEMLKTFFVQLSARRFQFGDCGRGIDGDRTKKKVHPITRYTL